MAKLIINQNFNKRYMRGYYENVMVPHGFPVAQLHPNHKNYIERLNYQPIGEEESIRTRMSQVLLVNQNFIEQIERINNGMLNDESFIVYNNDKDDFELDAQIRYERRLSAFKKLTGMLSPNFEKFTFNDVRSYLHYSYLTDHMYCKFFEYSDVQKYKFKFDEKNNRFITKIPVVYHFDNYNAQVKYANAEGLDRHDQNLDLSNMNYIKYQTFFDRNIKQSNTYEKDLANDETLYLFIPVFTDNYQESYSRNDEPNNHQINEDYFNRYCKLFNTSYNPSDDRYYYQLNYIAFPIVQQGDQESGVILDRIDKFKALDSLQYYITPRKEY